MESGFPTFTGARYLFGRTEFEAWQEFRHHPEHDRDTWTDSVDPIVEAGLASWSRPTM